MKLRRTAPPSILVVAITAAGAVDGDADRHVDPDLYPDAVTMILPMADGSSSTTSAVEIVDLARVFVIG